MVVDIPLQSTRVDFVEGDMNIDQYCFENYDNVLDSVDGTFKFNETVERFLEKQRAVVDDVDDVDTSDSLEELPLDQDHNPSQDDKRDVNDNDLELLRAKNLTLKIELEKKELLLNERENELKLAQLEISELTNDKHLLKEEVRGKNDALDTATAKTNSLEENKKTLESKLRTYSNSLRSLIKEKEAKDSHADSSAKVKELAATIKEKNKVIKSAETAQRTLANRLAELEKVVNDKKTDVDDKYKKVNDQLSLRTKEAKKANDDLKKSEKKAKELQEIISDKNKKLSEVENSNTRLRLMKDQAQEIVDKCDKMNKNGVKDDTAKVKKCRFENTGNCKNRNCVDFHPKKICQSFSKLGSCPMESACEHRHPYGVCYEWQNTGVCYKGDECRNKHPIEMAAPRTPNAEPFLGQGSPSGAHREGEGWRTQPSQWSPEQIRHHDQRGQGRW